jgi:ABC-type phosphate transport system substrate-binding protein
MRYSLRHLSYPLVAIVLLGLANRSDAEVVVVVSPQNPLVSLTQTEIADIFLGRTGSFSNGRDALPIDQSPDMLAYAEFYTRIAGKSPAQLRAYWSKLIFTGRGQPPREVSGGAEVKRVIASNRNAVGYMDKSDVDASVKVVLDLH